MLALQVFGSSRYQQLASKLVNMVNMMRAAGAQFTLDLPTVVVCGNQSAGKSSLVEGIINITLPRSDSTCTRWEHLGHGDAGTAHVEQQ